jgi:catechol 2,3-dioxygenase-like lactoylglutathione lyase family enzyme
MITHLDHLVLTVKDIPRSVAFYTKVLGMNKVVFGAGRVALSFGRQKINLHEEGQEFEPKAMRPTPGSADLCFISDASIESVTSTLVSQGIEIVEGPVSKTGACGPIRSIYFRDPDGNLIEISNYQNESPP